MEVLFVCYPRCTTCAKARRWLDGQGISYIECNIKENNPTEAELRQWAEKGNIRPRKFFNTSSNAYRELGLSKRVNDMTDDEMFKLLATDGMLVKRPVLVTGGNVLVGFKQPDGRRNSYKG